MLNKVKKTICDNNMIDATDKVLVALSGGCDSVCLCLVLKKLGVDFSVAHINHMIRAEADRDMEFCKEFAAKLNVSIYTKCVNVPDLAKNSGLSLELAGRNARYEFFEHICKEYGFSKVAVAHNLNDHAETVLLNLVRGTGLKGLCGIPKVRGNIIRPLIDVARGEIEEFVSNNQQNFVTDKTNFSNDYTRNKIRNGVLPILAEINPSVFNNISKMSDIIAQDDMYLNDEAKKYVCFCDGYSYVECNDFKKLSYALKARILSVLYSYAAGTGKDFEKKHIDYIIKNSDKVSGVILNLCFDVVCRAEYGKIIFEKRHIGNFYSYTLPLNGEIYIKEAGIKFTSKIISKDEMELYNDAEFFDYDALSGDITIRSRKNGDKIIPFGKNSSVKVKDVLIKDKVPLNIREFVPIIENDEILWIYGVRRSNKCRILSDTVKVLMIKGEKCDD